jgi:hypothetical protein
MRIAVAEANACFSSVSERHLVKTTGYGTAAIERQRL